MTYNHRIWQEGTSRGVDSSKTNQASFGDVITWKSSDKLKTLYLHYHNVYGYKTLRDLDLHWAAYTFKVTLSHNQVVLRDHMES